MDLLSITPRDDRMAKRAAMWADRLGERFRFLTARTTKRRPEVEVFLGQFRHLIYFGHGVEDALVSMPRFGRPKPLIDMQNLPRVEGRVVIAVACWSGRGLAVASTQASGPTIPVRAYLGWRDEIGWSPAWTEPVDDAVVAGLSPLLDGASVGQCKTALEEAFGRAHERYYQESGKRLSADLANQAKLFTTYWIGRMIVEGDADATLADP